LELYQLRQSLKHGQTLELAPEDILNTIIQTTITGNGYQMAFPMAGMI
jgi:hypothetical protein